MNILILFNSKVDPFGTHLAFCDSIGYAAIEKGHSPLVVDISKNAKVAVKAIASGRFDAIHLEQSHGAKLIKEMLGFKKDIPPFFSLVRDMPFYPWIKDNILPAYKGSMFFYVEESAVEAAMSMEKKHRGAYHQSLFTSSLIDEEKAVKRPSQRLISNLYVGSYKDCSDELGFINRKKELKSSLEMVIEKLNFPAHCALQEAFSREIDFKTEKAMVDSCFLINQVARSIRRERFISRISPKIPLTLVWNGSFPYNVKPHRDTVFLKPKNYKKTVELMHNSKNMWMVINNFGSALSERQLTAAAAGCIPFTTVNDSVKHYPWLDDVFHFYDINGNVSELKDASEDDGLLDRKHEAVLASKDFNIFSPASYIEKIEDRILRF